MILTRIILAFWFLLWTPAQAGEITVADILADRQWRTDTAVAIKRITDTQLPPALSRDEPVVRMVLQEAVGESYEGQVAVAGVAIDRAADVRWPSAVRDVVYQPAQFSGMAIRLHRYNSGEIYRARTAVQEALRGRRPCGVAYWFHTTSLTPPPSWAGRVRQLCVIGNHIFFGD